MEPIQKLCESLGAEECAVICSNVSRRFLSGVPSSAGTLLLTCEGGTLYLDSRYYEMACIKKERGLLPALLAVEPAVFSEAFAALCQSGKYKRAYLEDQRMTYAEWHAFEKKYPALELCPLENRVDALRLVKSADEIRRIRAAQALAEEALTAILPKIEAGRTELFVAAELEHYMKLHGAEDASFGTICVGGKKSSLPHGRPEDIVLEKNSFLTIDFGCKLEGYCSDMTRTFCIGRADEEMRRVYDTVLTAQRAGLAAARAGVKGLKVDHAARSVIEQAGYGEYFGHSTGHGIGLEVHEAPSFSPRYEGIIPAGAVLSVEPGIYLPGRFGVRIEDLVVITEDGCENLNRFPKDLMEL